MLHEGRGFVSLVHYLISGAHSRCVIFAEWICWWVNKSRHECTSDLRARIRLHFIPLVVSPHPSSFISPLILCRTTACTLSSKMTKEDHSIHPQTGRAGKDLGGGVSLPFTSSSGWISCASEPQLEIVWVSSGLGDPYVPLWVPLPVPGAQLRSPFSLALPWAVQSQLLLGKGDSPKVPSRIPGRAVPRTPLAPPW